MERREKVVWRIDGIKEETAKSEKRETSSIVRGTLSGIELTGKTVKKTNEMAITMA